MIHTLFPSKQFAGLLFDCDGTIADSMSLHHQAWNKALEPHGTHLTLKEHIAWAGRPAKKIIELLNARDNTTLLVDPIAKAKELHFLELLRDIEGIAPVIEVIKNAYGKIPMAVVSGGRRESVQRTLKHLQLTEYFSVVVTAEDYVNGKPAPDCFLMAAKRLNVSPENCLVFEDAQLGFESAAAAKMSCVRVFFGDQGKFELAAV